MRMACSPDIASLPDLRRPQSCSWQSSSLERGLFAALSRCRNIIHILAAKSASQRTRVSCSWQLNAQFAVKERFVVVGFKPESWALGFLWLALSENDLRTKLSRRGLTLETINEHIKN